MIYRIANLFVPNGCSLASESNPEDAAAKKRKEIAERLRSGKPLVVGKSGEIDKPTENDNRLVIPKGKLASFYWYEREPDLLDAEIDTMKRFFPNFELSKLDDGRYQWIGEIDPSGRGVPWILQVIYDNNHPSNSSYGGSVKIYSIQPDLEELVRELNSIPHVLRDQGNHLYLCTSRAEDFQASSNRVTSAAQSITWAVKWITVFEGWLDGGFTTEEFQGHTF